MYERLEAGLDSASIGFLRLAGVYERVEACIEAGLDRHFKTSGRVGASRDLDSASICFLRLAGVYERVEAGLDSASTAILRLAGMYERVEACLEAGLEPASTCAKD